jgi:acetyl esterase/lipase
MRMRVLGNPPAGVAIISDARLRPGTGTVVVFLHTWTVNDPHHFAPWIRHLTERDATIVFPFYQQVSSEAVTPPEQAWSNMLQGLRAALNVLPARPGRLVIMGITTGAVLALDYAARARSIGLGVPAAVLAIYPAVNLGSGALPLTDPSHISASTRLQVIAGEADPVPNGDTLAQEILRRAKQIPGSKRRYIAATDPNPAGPELADHLAQQSFWQPLDHLVGEASSG